MKKSFRCPCGSRREYSECCGKPRKVVSLAQVRWRRASSILRNRIGDFAEEVIFIKEAARAQDYYFAPLQDELEEVDPELMIERCFEWFIFDCPLSSGQTVLELFRDLFISRLPLTQALLLMLWEEERNRFYKVETVFPGKKIVIKDVLDGKAYAVRESGARLNVDPGTILYARLLRVGTDYEFSTSAIGVPKETAPNLLGWLHSDYQLCAAHRAHKREIGWDDYLRFRSPTICRKLVRLGLGYDDMPATRMDTATIPKLLFDMLYEPFGGLPDDDDDAGAEFDMLLNHLRGTDEPCRAEEYTSVAREVACGLAEIGSTPEEVNEALSLWWSFCLLEEPAIRKPGVWAASMIYTMVRFHGKAGISQGDLARRFGVASSSISTRYGRLARALALK